MRADEIERDISESGVDKERVGLEESPCCQRWGSLLSMDQQATTEKNDRELIITDMENFKST